MLEKIGEGKYGEVFKVVHRKTRKLQVGIGEGEKQTNKNCDPECLSSPAQKVLTHLEKKRGGKKQGRGEKVRMMPLRKEEKATCFSVEML